MTRLPAVIAPRPLAASILAVTVLLSSAALAAARTDGGCPAGGFDLVDYGEGGAQLIADLYPTVQAALDDGIYSLADLEAGADKYDVNGNQVVCIKDVYAHNGGHGQGFSYFVSAIDDAAAPR